MHTNISKQNESSHQNWCQITSSVQVIRQRVITLIGLVTFQIVVTHFLNGRLSASPQSHQQYSGLLSCRGALVQIRLLHAVAKTFRKRPNNIVATCQSRSLVLN